LETAAAKTRKNAKKLKQQQLQQRQRRLPTHLNRRKTGIAEKKKHRWHSQIENEKEKRREKKKMHPFLKRMTA
jgi:hypothetical protein